ncbi:MAG TPA: MoxR family ATPase [Vicinamibacteria bacterium]|nr:MoxR family ATPase [Vicinamibacteria bacterium]
MEQPITAEMTLDRARGLFDATRDEVSKVIVGQERLIEGVLVALFSEGSVLLEGAPGLGKTLLVNVLAKCVSCHFRRIQFTPDLMPSDLTGHSVFDSREGAFHFKPGPVFTNLLLTDEINRSPPKTQSALLEVMQERQVTVDGKTYRLRRPFLVLATQNPLEHEGTYPLPEAQVDRFMFKLLVDYPSTEEECEILGHYANGRDPRDLSGFDVRRVMKAEDVTSIQQATRGVIVEPEIVRYITEIVASTRRWHSVQVGSSPRGSVNLLLASRVLAACRGRNFVVPDDVKELAPWVLRHRLILRSEAEIEGESADGVLSQILDSVAAPRS